MKWFTVLKKRLFLAGVVCVQAMTATSMQADFIFAEPALMGSPISSTTGEVGASMSADGLELYVDSWRAAPEVAPVDLWVTKRATPEDEWGPATPLGPMVNSVAHDLAPRISPDGLELYFISNRGGGYGGWDIYVARRETTDGVWGPAQNLGAPVNTPSSEVGACVSADGLQLYYSSNGRLYVANRVSKGSDWSAPEDLGPAVNSNPHNEYPSISSDGLHLFFSDPRNGPYRPGGSGYADIWMTSRTTIDDDWGIPVNLGSPINSDGHDNCPWITFDGSMIVFCSHRSGALGSTDIWQAPIELIVDLNGDGKVDGKDLLMTTEYWGQCKSLCDIGPTPFGDGVVDVQDVIALAEYIGREVKDLTLVAHWALDETEGSIAHNSARGNSGTIVGLPVWQSAGGKVDGALELTGTTFIMGGYVLNPSDGPFSVLAWVKGGQPGQGIVTQQGGVDWLMVDALGGRLATELSRSLASETVITDGDWHRIGVTWDGSGCLLYVDDVLEAQSTEDGLPGSTGGMVIGSRRIMTPGTFFTGLIDDVRIYNRAVKP